MKSMRLSELLVALESESPEHLSLIDLQEGRFVIVEDWVMRAVQEADEEALRDLPAWQKEEVNIARAMVEDASERFVPAPKKFDFHEYRHMERFIGTVEKSEAADQLWRAIKGKGAFQHFKNTASRLGLLDQWHQYRDEAIKQFVIDWADDRKIPYEDDIKRRQR